MSDTTELYYIHEILADGTHWVSEITFENKRGTHAAQSVIAGWLGGQARWAVSTAGKFLYGLDAKGKTITSAPTT